MNILPKKSWHVRSHQNIERVRRDEEKAAAKEKEKQQRIAIAEQEARTSLLRDRARRRQTVEAGNSSSVVEDRGGHINFFHDAEESARKSNNKEYEAEKRAEKEEAEKKIGLLTYLGQTSLELKQTEPWYHKPSRSSDSKKEESSYKLETDRKKKQAMDPMCRMSKYVEEAEKYKLHKHNKHKKEKHKVKNKSGVKRSSSSKTVEELRAERLRREQHERTRMNELLAMHRGEKTQEQANVVELDDRKRGYNSQFNPEYVRKRRKYEDQ